MARLLRSQSVHVADGLTLKTWTFEAAVAAQPESVFDAISADPSTWTWFPGFRAGGYEGEPPYGVGTKRWVRVTGSTYRETIVAWERPREWAYRVDKSTVPLARHLVETWRVRPGDAGTNSVVSWEFAIEPRALFRAMSPVAPPVMGALFRRAMRNLERSLRDGG